MAAPQLTTYLQTFAAQDPGGWSFVADFARAADAAGIDRLVMSDHVVFGEDLESYADPSKGGVEGGRQPTGPDGHWLDPIATISYLMAVTSRVRFTTGILLAALRRPVTLAKELATMDVLSGGRLDVGVGVGWQREEYVAAGLPFERRGRLLNHTIEVCQALWQGGGVTYESPELSFSGIHQAPTPIQPGGIPIWVSGTVNRSSMDRLARYGSAWIPWGPDAADLVTGIGRMQAAMTERGRDGEGIGVVANLAPVRDEDGALDLSRTMKPVSLLWEAGATDFRLRLTPPEGVDLVEYLGVAVAAFRAASA